MDLTNLYLKNNYNTDKYNLGYLEHFYGHVFPKFQNSNINLLEIGCLHGGSIKMWKEYFSSYNNIYGIDVRDFPSIPGVNKIVGNAYSDKIVDQFQDDYFDIIIDDGPHTYQSFLDVIQKYKPKLKSNGILVIEDIVRPYLNCGVTPLQQEYLKQYSKELGYSSHKEYDLTGKQKTPILKDKWESGLFILLLTR